MRTQSVLTLLLFCNCVAQNCVHWCCCLLICTTCKPVSLQTLNHRSVSDCMDAHVYPGRTSVSQGCCFCCRRMHTSKQQVKSASGIYILQAVAGYVVLSGRPLEAKHLRFLLSRISPFTSSLDLQQLLKALLKSLLTSTAAFHHVRLDILAAVLMTISTLFKIQLLKAKAPITVLYVCLQQVGANLLQKST